jgi:hypothetical protein
VWYIILHFRVHFGVIKTKTMRWAHRILLGKPEGKKYLGRPRHRREGNKMYLRKMLWKGVKRNRVAQDTDRCQAFVNTAIKLLVP